MLHPADAVDVLSGLERYGWAAMVFLVVACGIVYLAYRYVRGIVRKAEEYLDDVKQSACDNLPVAVAETQTIGERIIERLMYIENEIERCHENAKADREETKEILRVIMRRFDDFASHAIAALRRNSGK